jgi:hypothetical protein
MHLAPPAALLSGAAEAGLVLSSSRSVALPSGKAFAVQVFRLPPDGSMFERPARPSSARSSS